MIDIPLLPAHPHLRKAAETLATAFRLTLVDTPPPEIPLLLRLTPTHLELCDMQTAMQPIYVDFVKGSLGYRRQHGGGRKQPLGRAIGLKPQVNPRVVDATAGLGRDAYVLAWLGCQVQMIERSAAISALLYDGLQRAYQTPKIDIFVKDRLQLIYDDACVWLAQLPYEQRPDVIYIDPMYPHRSKSALVKKAMRLFRHIVGNDEDAPTLLKTALHCARQRVVVKRPCTAPSLADITPTMSIHSVNTRFDVYLL